MGNCWALLGSSFLKSCLQSMKCASASSPQRWFLDADDELGSRPSASLRNLPTTSGGQPRVQSTSHRDGLIELSKEDSSLSYCVSGTRISLNLDEILRKDLPLPPFHT